VGEGAVAVSADVAASTGAETEGGRRPMRADALKNQGRILEAAEEVFALQGVSAPIDMVAERAGVGVGTVYRHFPTKEALFEAIVLSRLEELASAASAATQADDANEAFFSFLRLFARQVSKKHDLIDALGAAGIDIKSQCSATIGVLESGVERMLERAEAVGAVRGGVSTHEVIGLLVGVCQAAEQSDLDAASQERMVEVICDGLRPRSVAAPTGPGGPSA
jgi:AcrR family transcriptional regulator